MFFRVNGTRNYVSDCGDSLTQSTIQLVELWNESQKVDNNIDGKLDESTAYHIPQPGLRQSGTRAHPQLGVLVPLRPLGAD